MTHFHDAWIEQCEAAENIHERFGLAKAIGYLVGEKFITALRYAPSHPDLAKEIPAFAARIRVIFQPYELSTWFAQVRRLGPLGHVMSDADYRAFAEAGAVEDNPVAGAEEVLAMEKAKELLIGRV